MRDDLGRLPDRCVDAAQTVLPGVVVEVDEGVVEELADRLHLAGVERRRVGRSDLDHVVMLPEGVREWAMCLRP
ncbi:MAG TPA: hypothetical protein VIQ56_03125 [Gaiella sp.]